VKSLPNSSYCSRNRFFHVWSYHRTGVELYYGSIPTCKGAHNFIFYIFFTM